MVMLDTIDLSSNVILSLEKLRKGFSKSHLSGDETYLFRHIYKDLVQHGPHLLGRKKGDKHLTNEVSVTQAINEPKFQYKKYFFTLYKYNGNIRSQFYVSHVPKKYLMMF